MDRDKLSIRSRIWAPDLVDAAFDVTAPPSSAGLPTRVTLLELVRALEGVADSPDEVVTLARELLADGTVQLCGNFRNAPWALLGEPAPH